MRRWRVTTVAAVAALVVLSVGATGALAAWRPGDAWLVCLLVAAAAVAAAVPLAYRALRPTQMFLAQQDRLIVSALHELGGPLTQLSVVAESSLLDEEDDPATALRHAIAIARDASHTIGDLFDLATLASGSKMLEPETLRLDEVAREAIAERLGSMAIEGHEIHLDGAATIVLGHRGLLRRAVLNLVLNALRHARRSATRPTITVTIGQDHLTVSDDGPGIDEPTLRRYLAAVNSGNHTDGLGLGLTIVGWVAALHGGTVTAANRPEGGLTVTLRLPPGAWVGLGTPPTHAGTPAWRLRAVGPPPP